MYETFYNLRADPFRLSPDHNFCFKHRSFARARACLAYAFMRAEGFVMVTGQPGTGKTTLIGELIENLADDNVDTATLVFTRIQADDLLKMVAYSFGLESNLLKKAELLQRLHAQLRNWHREGRRALLVVDEAQNLSFSAMEELRLLTNIEADGVPLLQIFLLGQPELRELVLSPQMEQFHQRIIGASHITALEADETEAYIRYRLEKVGWQGDPAISTRIYPLIHKYSDGIPRRVNLICSRLFQYGCIEKRHEIGIRDIRERLVELQGENLAAGPALSEFDFEGDDKFESAPPSTDATEQKAPDPSTAPADSSNPGDVDAPQRAGARRTAISLALFAFLVALVLSVAKYGVGIDLGEAWREMGGKLLVDEHKPLQVPPAVAQPEEGAPRSNEIAAVESARPPPVLEDNEEPLLQEDERSMPNEEAPLQEDEGSIPNEEAPLQEDEGSIPNEEAPLQGDEGSMPNEEAPLQGDEGSMPYEEAPLQEDEGSMQNGSIAHGDAPVESVPEDDDGPSALLIDDFQPSSAEVDPAHSTATTRIEDMPVTDSSGTASLDEAPPEQSSPELPAVGRQSLPDESIESGAESEVLASMLPTSGAADAQTRQSKAPVEPPEEQVLLPSAKTIYQIEFDFASMDLTGDAHRILDLAIDKMSIQADSVALIRGFSDGTGSKNDKEELSRGRVAAVLTYMNAAGIEGQRLQVADVELPVLGAVNPAIDIEPGPTNIQAVEITVAWTERD